MPLAAATAVACLGDSITAGFWQQPADLWPAKLQAILGDAYVVTSLGKAGHTAQREGDQPYWATEEWTRAKELTADIVILMLGTNVCHFPTTRQASHHPPPLTSPCHLLGRTRRHSTGMSPDTSATCATSSARHALPLRAGYC